VLVCAWLLNLCLGLELILLQGDSIWVTTRPAIAAAFVRPRRIAELQGHGFLSVPCLGGDDLVLYLARALPDQPAAPVKFTRAKRRAKWTGPTPVKVAVPAGKGVRIFSASTRPTNFHHSACRISGMRD
jgi:hypothetical protein